MTRELIVHGPVIGNRDLFDGRLGKEKKPHRGRGGLGELLDLLERREGFAVLPGCKRQSQDQVIHKGK